MDKEIEIIFKRLKEYVRKFVRDDDTANNIVQETIIKALHKGKLLTKHIGWMCVTARREVYKLTDSPQISLPDFENLTEIQSSDDSIIDYMHLLNENERYILYLRYFQQLSLKELSTLLNKPEGTLKRKLYEARQSLKKEVFMNTKMASPEIKVEEIHSSEPLTRKICGQALLMGNPALIPGDCELIHYYEYPGRIYSYESETEVTRVMQLAGNEVVEVTNSYKKRKGERKRRMYYKVTEDNLEMVMRIFEWEEGGIEVQTDPLELVPPSHRLLKLGKTITENQVDIIDLVNLQIGDKVYPNTFRVRSACIDYHGKEFSEMFFSEEGREVLQRNYIGDDWKMGGYVTWEKMEKSLQINFENESYRLWTESILINQFRKEI
jgi:RNA polymerase sigma-70 factor (ECF subfamily)